MNSSLNKKKYLLVNKRNAVILFFLFIIFFLLIFFYFNKSNIEFYTKKYITYLSDKYEYELKSFEVNGLNLVNINEIENVIKPYYSQSIFLLPLNRIAKSIKENPWIKNIDISTNFKNILYININEYIPFAIYKFNNNNYYITNEGKIIDLVRKEIILTNEYIIFSGKLSNIHADSFIEMIKENNFFLIEKVINANFVAQRRWDLSLENGIILKLSEKTPSTSLQNYIKLRKNLNNIELQSIKEIDLRDFQKAIIKFK